ncbi:hypothetical protein XM38_010140 [Halomicronema hongdechloris C2206]|uniref:Uncharacterized protein n=1 Tax=Halomicronema hongdechloris C2206 TaxID=1641165 RepID=A0A1Z3HID6_9CYAN|nr:hypothetical protein [Halomicronema hongdechloris]ASC70084.1 hypothetical protein XM38_010140 [Halomicronema hongdechloris C2206]
MTSPLYSDSFSSLAADADAPTAAGYAPSVPISVYRQLATELQATKAKVEALTAQNQQVMRQNHQLRQEIHRFLQATDQLRYLAGPSQSPQPPPQTPPVPAPQATAPEGSQLRATRSPESKSADADADTTHESGTAELVAAWLKPVKSWPAAGNLFSHQSDSPHQTQPTPTQNSRDLSGLWLATTILLIVVSAFGAGFLIMKPLLNTTGPTE